MQKKVGRKVYNTEKSRFVGRNAQGSYGDPSGFEEHMYMKGPGDFFLLVSGGPESPYPNEDIIPLELMDAKEWIERVRGPEVVGEFISINTKPAGPNKKAPVKKKEGAKKTVKKATSLKGNAEKVSDK